MRNGILGLKMTIGVERDGESIRCRSSGTDGPPAVCSARRRGLSASTNPTLVPNGFERKRLEARRAPYESPGGTSFGRRHFGIYLAGFTDPLVRRVLLLRALRCSALFFGGKLRSVCLLAIVALPGLIFSAAFRHFSGRSTRAVRRVGNVYRTAVILSLTEPLGRTLGRLSPIAGLAALHEAIYALIW